MNTGANLVNRLSTKQLQQNSNALRPFKYLMIWFPLKNIHRPMVRKSLQLEGILRLRFWGLIIGGGLISGGRGEGS